MGAVSATPISLALLTSVCSSHPLTPSISIFCPKPFSEAAGRPCLYHWQDRSAEKLTPSKKDLQPIIGESWCKNTLAPPPHALGGKPLSLCFEAFPRVAQGGILCWYLSPPISCFLAPPNKPFSLKSLSQGLLLKKSKLRWYSNEVRGIIRKKGGLTVLKITNIYIPLHCELLETKECILISYPQCLAHTRHSLSSMIAYRVSHMWFVW